MENDKSIVTEAYVAYGPERNLQKLFSLEEVVYDQVGDHEVLVDIVAFGICHTDIKAAQGTFRMETPLICGHEGAGIVRQVGDKVSYVQAGDQVALSYASCGRCRNCALGRAPYCEGIFSLNFNSEPREANTDKYIAAGRQSRKKINNFFFGQSSMAKLALVREGSCVKVNDVPREKLKMLAPLGCGIQTGAGGILNVLKPPPHSTIGIWGAGAVGLAACLAAKLTSPARLIMIDNSKTKLDSIPKDWATDFIDASRFENQNVMDEILRLTNNVGLDYAIDAVGLGAILASAHQSLTPCGTLLTLGGSLESPKFTVEQHLVNGITYRGTHQGDSVSRVMIPKLIQLQAEGKFPFDELITYYPFDDLDRALEDMKSGKVIKAVLVRE